MNIRLENSTDAERINDEKNKKKIVNEEIKELESQKKVLIKNIKRQQKIMNKLYDDPEYREKREKANNGIKQKKEEYYLNDEVRKVMKIEQKQIIEEMTKLNKEKYRLIEAKKQLETGCKTNKMKMAMKAKEELIAMK